MTSQQREQFDTDGYILVENALEDVGLDRVRQAHEAVQKQTESAWQQFVVDGEYKRKGVYGHGPNAHATLGCYRYDDLFLDIANNPQVIPFLEDVVGPDLQCVETICHTHHVGTEAHTEWQARNTFRPIVPGLHTVFGDGRLQS